MLMTLPLWGAESGLEVRPEGKELIEVSPKNTVTAVFRVTNINSPKQEFITEVELPNSWKLITQDFPFTLDKNQTEIKLLSFFVPQNTLAGQYPVTYRVKGRAYPSFSDFYRIQIVVLPFQKLEVNVLKAPMSVIAGEPYSVSFVVVNASNVADSIEIAADNSENYPVSLESKGFGLLTRESKQVTATVQTNQKLIKMFKQQLRLTANFVKDKNIKATSYAMVDIIPRITGIDDRYNRFPVEARLIAVVEKNGLRGSGFQGDVSGDGFLDDKSTKRLNFRFRGPDIYEKSILAERDEYTVGFSTDRYFIHVGDRNYSLSPLLENFRYGRGVEGKINLNRFSIGTFYQKPRWIWNAKEEMAAYTQYSFKENQIIRLNFLQKNLKNQNADIYSLESKIRPFKSTNAEVEYALSRKNNVSQNAFRMQINGQQNTTNYTLNYIHAAADFAGYYQDTDLLSTGLSFSLFHDLRFNANFHQEKQNFELDTARYVAPLTRYYQVGFNYYLKSSTSFNFDFIKQGREDRLENPKFNYNETSFRFTIYQDIRKLCFSGSAEAGRTVNQLTDKTSSMERYTFSATFSPGSSQSYRGYIYYDNNSRTVWEKSNQLIAGLNLSLLLAQKTSFYLNFQNTFSDEEYYTDRTLFELQLTHVFPNLQKITLHSRFSILRNSLDKKERAVLADYTIPIGVPISIKKNVGRVKGYVFDIEKNEPVKDLIIRINGSAAVTNKKGGFIFPALNPGTYHLSIDKSKIGMNKITTQPTPMAIVVEGGQEQVINLGITRSASLSGRVMVYTSVEDSLLQSKNEKDKDKYYIIGNGDGKQHGFAECCGLANVIVELSREGEIIRRITDSKGNFSFEEIRPGKWQLKAYDTNLPKYHSFEKSTYELEFKPGEKKDILLKVLLKKRQIRFLQEGGTIIQEKNK